MVGALLLGTCIAAPVAAMQAAAPDAATRAALEKRTAARTMLSSAVSRLATNANDTSALLDAGRASIELEDYRAAITFLTRAEQASPRDGSIKAALGSAMVHMETPTRALDYFGEAQLLGAPERLFLADRGLARDLLGQQDAAQRDYQLALSLAPNEETVRRYALSLAISGEPDRAIQFLTPQLKAQDRAAWRLRAMILAINGRNDEATEIVNATMPAALAQNIIPYLVKLDRLNPAQQAAAAHFGRFPSGQLGPPRKPVQIAAATPSPAPAPVATGKRGKPPAAAPKAAVKPTPAPATARQPALASAEQYPPGFSPTPKPAAARAPAPAGTEQLPPGFSPTPKPAPAPALTGTRPAAAAITPTSASGAAASGPPELQSSFRPTIRPATSVPPAGPAAAPASPPASSLPASASATTPTSVDAAPAKPPVGPGFSINDLGRPADAAPAPAVSASSAPETAAAMPSPPSSSAASVDPAPLASLAAIASSIEIPTEELAQADNAIGADTLAKLREEKRRADAAEAAKREKDEAAAKAKAEADAKAKAEAAEKKANPARLWVQIATGANPKALATDFGKFAKKSPDLFKGKAGATTEWGKTRRLLVGPFKDKKAAQDWLASYKKAGGDGFLFNSEAGQDVDPIK
jgi:Flp pilus assembly protein TadD